MTAGWLVGKEAVYHLHASCLQANLQIQDVRTLNGCPRRLNGYFFFLPLCRFKMIWVTPKDKFFRRWRDQDPKVADFDQSITQYIELSNKVSPLTEGSSANPTFMLSFVILSHLIPVIDTASLLAKCCVCSVPYSDFSSPSLPAPLLFIICM